ncbi:MAG: hypothetical protein A2556_00860 [Candidatus Vogelbacteria bacterium RIFOXYD2_FULL_44_9]|uniref:Uncharacterized protein n=1 Tax=Candidatus Vogelbacteria bacterium RIFOXYD2_FULL_44_9 TaxID=1802441 RepID=A0A1G2QJY6_9BACT|nr:MAG: hypothetical protein A2556_00860 [Candidatus Vogelbacteria bacterium RIFOXYD2_FULL_44_9]
MDYNKLVTQIIVGSNNLNQMRDEIKLVVGTILSMIDSWKFRDFPNESIEFRTPHGSWVIGRKDRTTLWARFTDDGRGWFEQHEDSSVVPPTLSLTWVRIVHSYLPALLEGVLVTFPEVGRNIQPILDAGIQEPWCRRR